MIEIKVLPLHQAADAKPVQLLCNNWVDAGKAAWNLSAAIYETYGHDCKFIDDEMQTASTCHMKVATGEFVPVLAIEINELPPEESNNFEFEAAPS